MGIITHYQCINEKCPGLEAVLRLSVLKLFSNMEFRSLRRFKQAAAPQECETILYPARTWERNNWWLQSKEMLSILRWRVPEGTWTSAISPTFLPIKAAPIGDFNEILPASRFISCGLTISKTTLTDYQCVSTGCCTHVAKTEITIDNQHVTRLLQRYRFISKQPKENIEKIINLMIFLDSDWLYMEEEDACSMITLFVFSPARL